jgi:hypothetical protein
MKLNGSLREVSKNSVFLNLFVSQSTQFLFYTSRINFIKAALYVLKGFRTPASAFGIAIVFKLWLASC